MRLTSNRRQVIETINNSGYEIVQENRLPNDLGSQFRLETGQIIVLYDTGTLVVQGRDVAVVRKLFGVRNGSKSVSDECLSPG